MNERKPREGETVREYVKRTGSAKGITDPPLPDEDLTTPEHLLHDLLLPTTPRASLEKTAGIVARGLVTYALDPENQAYMLGCVLAAPFTSKMRMLPGILFTMCGGYAARQAYRASRDLRKLAESVEGPGADPPAAA